MFAVIKNDIRGGMSTARTLLGMQRSTDEFIGDTCTDSRMPILGVHDSAAEDGDVISELTYGRIQCRNRDSH